MSSAFNPSDALRWRAARVDNAAIRRRVTRVRARSIKTDSKDALLRMALSMVDLTTLEGRDTPQRVRALCHKARRPLPERPDLPSVAAVCVYPSMVPHARAALEGSDVKLAAVATGFPSGQIPLPHKLEEVRSTVAAGADEIDMVIDRGAFLAGDDAKVFDEIAATKEARGDARLKVILETGELGNSSTTSPRLATGHRGRSGLHQDIHRKDLARRDARRHAGHVGGHSRALPRDGVQVGMKPAGGIRDAKLALHYLVLVAETLAPGGWTTTGSASAPALSSTISYDSWCAVKKAATLTPPILGRLRTP